MPAFGNENVRWLDIAVHHAFGMRGIQSVGYLNSQRQHGVDVQRSSTDLVLQRHAF